MWLIFLLALWITLVFNYSGNVAKWRNQLGIALVRDGNYMEIELKTCWTFLLIFNWKSHCNQESIKSLMSITCQFIRRNVCCKSIIIGMCLYNKMSYEYDCNLSFWIFLFQIPHHEWRHQWVRHPGKTTIFHFQFCFELLNLRVFKLFQTPNSFLFKTLLIFYSCCTARLINYFNFLKYIT